MPATIIQRVPNWRSSTQPSPIHVSTEKKIDRPAAYAMLLPRAASRSCVSPFSGSRSAIKTPRLLGQLLAPQLREHALGLHHLDLGRGKLGRRVPLRPGEQLISADPGERDDADDDRPLDERVEQAGDRKSTRLNSSHEW